MLKLILSILIFSGSVHASDISSRFKEINKDWKGAFGQNMMQRWGNRLSYSSWEKSGKPSFVFQSAFRSENAKALLEKHGMYTGNLFATNYYELRAEFLLGDASADNLSKSDDLKKLVQTSKENPQVFKRAQQMVQNWNLEKLYILKNPSSGIAKGFKLRGVGGAEFEQKYGQKFVNYYIEESSENTDLLVLVKLVESSALVSSNNFTKIRNKATSLYEKYRPGGSKSANVGKSLLKRIKHIRDSIHNQLTPAVLNLIDDYMSETRSNQAHTELKEIKSLIQSYFATGVVDIKHIAKQAQISTANLDSLDTSSPSLENLVAFSNSLIASREKMTSSSVDLDKKYLYLAYSSVARSFLFDKARTYIAQNRINGENLTELTQVVLSLVYLEGFINKSDLALGENVPSNYDEYEEQIFSQLLDQVISTVKKAYAPMTEKWVQVDKRMSGIVDDSIRASTMAVLFEHILEKMD